MPRAACPPVFSALADEPPVAPNSTSYVCQTKSAWQKTVRPSVGLLDTEGTTPPLTGSDALGRLGAAFDGGDAMTDQPLDSMLGNERLISQSERGCIDGKTAGKSLIAYGAIGFVASITGLSGDVILCNLGPLILIYLGTAVYSGSRFAGAFAIFFCAIHFVSATAILVSAAMHGMVEIGAWAFCASVVLGSWALLNMALLALFRNAKSRMATLAAQFPVATAPPPRWLPFLLRSMFVLAILVTLGCWLGMRLLRPTSSWNLAQCFKSRGEQGLWCVGVVGYRSGKPAIGYLWRVVGKQPQSPKQISLSIGKRPHIEVNGVEIQPTEDFQLFVNDLHDKPMRLVIPAKDAKEVFGRNLDMSRIESFWDKAVEPRRGRRTAAPTGKK